MVSRTERLYQRDAFLTRFQAAVLDAIPERSSPAEDSARLAISLDRTAFYPTGGGQPHDTGWLAGLPVVDVRESESGPLHVVELRDAGGRPHGAHLTVGATVEGAVDWPRRFDHMQQHSGQHILSRAFVDVASAPTRSFHLGEAICTIDVALAEPDPDVIRAAEARANAIVWEDCEVRVREIEGNEAAAAGVRLKPGDPLRLIEVGGFDSTPCGGTHVARAGQIGLIGVLAWERWKGMSRVTFACGGRAARALRESHDAVSGCVARLSARPHELANAIDRLLLEREEISRRARALGEIVAAHEAAEIAATAPRAGGFQILRRSFTPAERSVDDALALTRLFASAPGRLAVVSVVDGATATLLAARCDREEAQGPKPPKMGDLVREIAASLGGRGGGSVTQGRAGGIPAARAGEAMDRVLAGHGAGPGDS
ncbi:MAG: phosphoesterase [Acidobacteria bacterium]|nr:phosphoesterase [Acidobacteriota bacterium]